MRDDIVLKPWGFKKNEEVELYWICSPHLNDDHNWMMKAVFKSSDGKIKETMYPWGTLQLLRLGYKYVDGKRIEPSNSNGLREINIPNSWTYRICKSFDMPKVLYTMYENFEYGSQKMCHFYIDNMNYYIPCIELLRSILIPSKILTNYIMRPHGLESLVDNTYTEGRNLYIDFNNEYPTKLVNDESVYHFVWLMYNKAAKTAWDKVYNGIFRAAVESTPLEPGGSLKKNTYIEMVPPFIGRARWTYRGITINNSTLILELKAVQGLDMPSFDKIYYSHPSLYNLELVDEPKTIKNATKESEDQNDYEMDESGNSSRKDTNQPAIDVPATMFGFNRKPKMIKCRKRSQKLRTGEPGEEREGSGGKLEVNKTIISTQDWALSGNIKPIEFNALEIVKEDPYRGLEKFLYVITYIEKYYRRFEITLTIVYLPYKNAFSVCPDGYRRTCAIVKVSQPGQIPCYIIEVGRPDGWAASTLLMWPLTSSIDELFIEKTIYRILQKLAENNGHWNNSFLNQQLNFKFETGKHIKEQTVMRWAETIVNKLL